jgi:AcrR family transcriptional regulator
MTRGLEDGHDVVVQPSGECKLYRTVYFVKSLRVNSSMARRGTELSEHILFEAKNVFLEMGFERASMDEIANRAKTSKRSLYAHFESKEKLYFAIIDLARKIFLGRLKMPGDYAQTPNEALVKFCGRLQEILIYTWTIKMCRLSMAVVERFPEDSAQYSEVIFTMPVERLSSYIKQEFGYSSKLSSNAAHALLNTVVYPRFQRALFGLEPLLKNLDDETINPDFDLEQIRKAVAQWFEWLPANAKKTDR